MHDISKIYMITVAYISLSAATSTDHKSDSGGFSKTEWQNVFKALSQKMVAKSYALEELVLMRKRNSFSLEVILRDGASSYVRKLKNADPVMWQSLIYMVWQKLETAPLGRKGNGRDTFQAIAEKRLLSITAVTFCHSKCTADIILLQGGAQVISNHSLGPTIHIKACDMKAGAPGGVAGDRPCGCCSLTN